jgi:glycosyltransferase involved in cell wall biosynthesis
VSDLHGPGSVGTPGSTIALLPWGVLYDVDYLDPIGVSLEAFCTEMTGGFLFNYVDALRLAGIRTLIVIVAHSVKRVTRMTHASTGATVLILPPSPLFRPRLHGTRSGQGRRVLGKARRLRATVQELAAYLSTPLGSLSRELRREGCAALLCQEYEYSRFDTYVLVGRWLRIPVFATFQGGTPAEGYLQRLCRPLALRRCAGLIIGPRLETQRVQGRYHLPETKIARIFNPIDPESFQATPRAEARATLGLPPGARVALWYGRVERQVKGLDVLLDAWERVCRERPGMDLRLLLIGTGMDAEWLRRRIGARGVRGICWRDEYVHDRSVLRLHLSAADVFAFPSRREGFPMAPIEALACGVPVVAAAAPGIPDILEGGEAAGGIVVPCEDAARFARELGGLLDDPQRAMRIGHAGQERARTCFSLEMVGCQLRDFMVERGLRLPKAASA